MLEIVDVGSTKAHLRAVYAAWRTLACNRNLVQRVSTTNLFFDRHRLLTLGHRFAEWRLTCAIEQQEDQGSACSSNAAASGRQGLQALRSICAQQEAEILQLKGKDTSAQQRCMELQARCDQLTKEVEHVQTQSTLPRQEVLMLRELCSQQDSELRESRERCNGPKNEVLELTRLCEEQVLEIEGLRQQVLAPQHDLQELRDLCQQQALEIQNLNKIDEAPEDEIISLQATCDQQVGELEELRKQIQEAHAEIERVRGLCEKRDVAFEALKKQAGQVQELCTQQKADMETMQAEVETKSRDLQQLQGLRALCEQQALQIEQLRCASRVAETLGELGCSGSCELPGAVVMPPPIEEAGLAPQAQKRGMALSPQVKLEDEVADPPARTPHAKRRSPNSSSSSTLAKTLTALKPVPLSAEVAQTSPRPASETSAHSSCPSPHSAVLTPSRLQNHSHIPAQFTTPASTSTSSKTTMRRVVPGASRSASLPATANVRMAKAPHVQVASGLRVSATSVAPAVTPLVFDGGGLPGKSPRGRPWLSAAIPEFSCSAASWRMLLAAGSNASTAQTCIPSGTRRAASQPPQRLDASACPIAMQSIPGAITPQAGTPDCAGATKQRLATPRLSNSVGFTGNTAAAPIVISAPKVSPIAAVASARAAAATTVVLANSNVAMPRMADDVIEHLVATAATPQRHALLSSLPSSSSPSSSLPCGAIGAAPASVAAVTCHVAAPHLVAAVAARQAELARSRAVPGPPQETPLSATNLWEQQAGSAPPPELQRQTHRGVGCSAVQLDAVAAPPWAATGCLAASHHPSRTNTLT